MTGTEDPGWRAAFWALIPFLGRRALETRRPDGLTVLRSIFVGLISALLLFAVAISYVAEIDGDPAMAQLVVIGVGVLSHLALALLGRRKLSTGSIDDLGDSWRTRMFTGVGLAELPGLVAIPAAIISDSLWVYLLGMAFALAGFWRIAPSSRNLARDQEAISSTGSPLSLIEALMKAGPYAPPASG